MPSSGWPTILRAVVVTGLVAAGAALSVASLHQPLGFDEAYNLQIVGHLLRDHVYATDGLLLQQGESATFDYRITTGPTLMLPVALAAAVLGEYVWVYRLVPLVFFGLLTASWYRTGRALGGFWVGVCGATVVLALDTAGATLGSSTLLGPGDVLGEIAAAALLLLACRSVSSPGRAGLLVGLALLTKTVALFAAPGIALVAIWAVRRSGSSLRALLSFCGAALLPVLIWQVVRVATVGPTAAQEANGNYLRFAAHGGSGFGPTTSETSVGDRLQNQAALLSLPTQPWWLLVIEIGGMLALAVMAVVGLRVAMRATAGAPTPLESAVLPVVAAVVSGVTIQLWWLLLAEHDWVRHSAVGVYLFLPGAFVAAALSLRTVRPRTATLAKATLAVGLCLCLGARVMENQTLPGPDLEDQRRLAMQLQDGTDGYHYAGVNLLADLMLLGAGTPEPLSPRGGLVVLVEPGVTPNPAYDQQLRACDQILFDEEGYTGCWVPPGPVPAPLAAD